MKNLAIIKIHHSFFPILIAVCFVFHLSTALSAEGNELGKRLVQEQCSTCHNFEGKAES
jgi:mono/diheme cytochrome c family protein